MEKGCEVHVASQAHQHRIQELEHVSQGLIP